MEALEDHMDPENAPGTDSFPAEFYTETFGTNKHLV